MKTAAASTNARSGEDVRTSYQTLKTIDSKVSDVEEDCEDLEADLGIKTRWEKEDPDYIEALNYSDDRKYHRALDKLQYLVVQRLMELHKCHVRGTSKHNLLILWMTDDARYQDYKLRTHIAKHLQARSQTIRRALTAYNLAAGKLKRGKLNFQEVIQMSFLAEFDLLCISRNGDMCAKA